MATWYYRFSLPDGEHFGFTTITPDMRMEPDEERLNAIAIIRRSVLGDNPEASLLDETLGRVQHNGHQGELIKKTMEYFHRRYPHRLPAQYYTGGAPVRVLTQPWLVPGSQQMPDPARDLELAEREGRVLWPDK